MPQVEIKGMSIWQLEKDVPSDSYLSTLPNNKRVTEGKQYEDTWKIIKG